MRRGWEGRGQDAFTAGSFPDHDGQIAGADTSDQGSVAVAQANEFNQAMG